MTLWVEPLMVTHNPTKTGDHRHLGDGHIMLLAIEGQDSACFPKSVCTIYF